MKTIISISLSFLIFFQSVGIGMSDVFMLNDLIEHAKYHSETYGDDFFTFLEKHYGTLKAEHEKNKQEENHDHKKLPFQHNNCNHLLIEIVLVFYEFPIKKSEISYPQKHHSYYQDFYSFLNNSNIFQPPQIA